MTTDAISSRAPTPDERNRWQRDGFVPLPGLFPRNAVTEVERLLDGLYIAHQAARPDDWTQQRDGQATSVEILRTTEREPRLLFTEVYRRCECFASQLLNMPVECVFEHVIRKPGGVGTGTFWHQDCYYEKVEPWRCKHRVHFWIPMADVALHGGAMRYVPNTHGGQRYPHDTIPGERNTHYVMASGFDQSTAVDVPIQAGGAIAHHPHLLHASGPNTSPEGRTAWILQFARPRTVTQKLYFRALGLKARALGQLNLNPAAD
ncbi:putative Phytanoyl-CoA dioxygenase [Thiomonas arsenitoxydans]|uniref:Phytanoyl-CoA dioxygenase n=1 Tax=Thiomonas arsenitoxydans (strain DSM 22701 / CIP 110005 / 3As) TaxID=426114 RepID=D6CP76_THIA3|nr:phytanoyl-CoA dioxygenase family protein [Thiomonas arsenitoxydans]CAZ90354.1 putative Phytanoyl-CoA dioxygenase [Thiomonas arsenitoxydans]CQR28178.1 putative Phytanoyl-CoA dioxygenase [Thiomonas arsenitoxydans]CQR28180.1 putative Phytanoyl-CoA dioxygenase [Thiomonas arsenitoxydans]CQR28676.1 putative Phytanoyl-CoA dioxygenase [Thiomonas arsenitoxydans]CQR31155.1 putative Phytanoyl-CoA dioxygenase [Thiomonas arsenitoxydans]